MELLKLQHFFCGSVHNMVTGLATKYSLKLPWPLPQSLVKSICESNTIVSAYPIPTQ